ncbi:MAG: sugar phosphate isomerase/epimerase [Pseudomonadota bacterium]
MQGRFPFALHTWTIDTTPLDVALGAARKAGYHSVELRRLDFTRCFEQGQSLSQVIDTIEHGGVEVSVLGTEYGLIFSTGEERERLFDVFRETCKVARKIGCGMVMCAPGQTQGSIAHATDNVRGAADIAGEYGLRFAVEFNSQHPVINNTAVLQEIVHGAQRPNCGLLLDAYHLFRSTGIEAGLRDVTAEELFVFQYSDVPPVPQAGVRRPVDRLVPGTGLVDWPKLNAILRKIGYNSVLSYEAPNPALWARSPHSVALEGLIASRKLFAPPSPAAQAGSDQPVFPSLLSSAATNQASPTT